MRILMLAVAAALMPPPAALAAPVPAPPPAPSFTYADLADLAGRAPIVADVQVLRATRLKAAQAAGVAPGFVRFYVEGTVLALIRGAEGLPGQISWLVDLPLDAGNRVPKLPRKTRLLLLAGAGTRPGEVRLAAPYAQLAWNADLDARLRAILTAMTATDAPPGITGIGNAFHVPGSLPGESETQIFLRTADARPISLNVLRRPGEQPHWAVALGEMVDEAAGPPAPESLLWYRLACSLPPALPESATTELAPPDAAAAAEDYRFVVAGLGRCARNYGAP